MKQTDTILNCLSTNQHEVFAELYASHQKKLYEFILHYTRVPTVAEDLTQDIFTKLWTKREMLSRIDNVGAYLLRMGRNESISYLRRESLCRSIFQTIKEETDIRHSNDTEEILYQKEMEVLLRDAIQQLSPQRRKVYVLGKIEGMEPKKIAAALGIAIGTVKETQRLANRQIREHINARLGLKTKRRACRRKLLEILTLRAA
jgi:RNA polymerase sigma-70 factor (family 1)